MLHKAIILLLGLTLFSFNQTQFLMDNEAEFYVSGTSNVRDWDLKTKTATGKAEITYDEKINAITYMEIQVPTESLKGSIPGIDPVVYKTLKSKKYPMIRFTLKEIKSLVHGNDHTKIIATGVLAVSGRSRIIQLNVKADHKNNLMTFEGTTPLRFSEFNLAPPTAFFGAIKAADEMKIMFKVKFNTPLNRTSNNQKPGGL